MVCSLGECISVAGGFYNLTLMIIIFILFVVFLRNPNKKVYLKPWKLLFFALCVYVVEEISQVLLNVGGLPIPLILFPLYEMIIITAFIYMLMLQKNYIKTGKRVKW